MKTLLMSGKEILDQIRSNAKRGLSQRRASPFVFEELKNLGKSITDLQQKIVESPEKEWRAFATNVQKNEEGILVNASFEEFDRFKDSLSQLELSYKQKSIRQRENTLQNLIFLGQEILRRQYFAELLHPGVTVVLSKPADVIVEVGAQAIQFLGRAPAGPKQPYRKFNRRDKPSVDDVGIEILSSGEYPDRFNDHYRYFKDNGQIRGMGFENVLGGVLDSPRALVLKKAFEEGAIIHPLDFPRFNRTMLDLELMRLGQATTPGTTGMLLNSFYYGALFVDHSTNVSEQVQVILAKEEWNPAVQFQPGENPEIQAKASASSLLTEFFRHEKDSPIAKAHPREARIQFSGSDIDEKLLDYFKSLKKVLHQGIRVDGQIQKAKKDTHTILPTIHLSHPDNVQQVIKHAIDVASRSRINRLAIHSEVTHDFPGLLQYLGDIQETNELLLYAKEKRVRLISGRSVDMTATENKTIQAAAGAIESGQGCIKIGLLGLTFEEMIPFIRNVKTGIGASYRKDENQHLVFIGLIDEPLVSEGLILTDPYEISIKFIDLMRRTRHDYLLLDTMHKGSDKKRFLNAGDGRGGHLIFDQLKSLSKDARDINCDLWIAGSIKEEQVYQLSKLAPDERPSLICLGGAERSFRGVRLESRDTFTPKPRNREEQRLSFLLQYHSEIKYLLSRDNKLSRDAGHVAGHLSRLGKNKETEDLEKLRKKYNRSRRETFKYLQEAAESLRIYAGNIDDLYNKRNSMIKELDDQDLIDQLQHSLNVLFKIREQYFQRVTDLMYNLFSASWFSFKPN